MLFYLLVVVISMPHYPNMYLDISPNSYISFNMLVTLVIYVLSIDKNIHGPWPKLSGSVIS